MIRKTLAVPDFDEIRCSNNDHPVCPYCKHINKDPDSDLIDGFEAIEWTCIGCGKVFSINACTITIYSTEPYERYYLNQQNDLNEYLGRLKRQNADLYLPSIHRTIAEMEKLEEDAERILGVTE